MSSMFDTHQQALDYARAVLRIPSEATFEQIETEQIGSFGSDLLIAKGEAEGASERDKLIAKSIQDTVAAQTTYRAMIGGEEHLFEMRDETTGTVHFTIGPFRDGFDCWLVFNGMANRL